ncbi:Ankyrin repeat and SAM domain-containing protein 1A [Symbiodinium microadriaticum]|uniref:Ankyrin repeat and SAM domain-containing protein 1A n=1 Tax=Symbiodinium microadriaticum TaxID=2951 RepID=A0A1Q9E074_SYMMI|nr:Ankyrin repeat and SAM domain-containing protein 1A [Symbiodinium microadriaticum]
MADSGQPFYPPPMPLGDTSAQQPAPQAADGADWPSHDPNQDAIAVLRQAMIKIQEAYDKLTNDKSETPGCQAPTLTETVAEGKEFEYKGTQFKSTSLLHQYCAMSSLNAEQLSTVDAMLSGMRPDADDWWGINEEQLDQLERRVLKKVHALHVATFCGNAVLVRKLLKAEADINVQEMEDKDGKKKLKSTSLHVAIWYQQPEVIKVLLEKRADPSIIWNGFTSLHHAARFGNAEAVQGILDTARQQRLFECQNEDWKTTTFEHPRSAIQLACENGSLRCFQLLLEAMEEEKKSAGEFPAYWGSNRSKEHQKDMVNYVFEKRPRMASLLLEHYHDMAVVRELLKDREVEIITQILKNSADWKTVLDNFVKDPEQMLAADGTHSEKWNSVNFWTQNFTNRWDGKAFLRGDVRCVRHTPTVLDYGGDAGDDKQEKQTLANKLKGSNGLAMAQKFVEVGLIPMDADLLASDEILKAIALDANCSLLDTKFVRAVLDDSWAKVKVWYFWHVFWAFFQVAMTCVVSASLRDARPAELPDTGGQVPAAAFVLLSMVWLKRLTEEVYQLFLHWCSPPSFSCLMKTLCSFDTALDWLYLSISGLALGFLWPFDGPFNAWPIRRSLIAFYFVLVWLSALYWLRGVAGFSEKLLPILWAIRATGTFLIVVSFTFAAAVHGYFVLSIPNMPPGLYRAFEKTFRLGFLGDFDLYELEFVDPIFVPGETAGVLEPEDPQPGEDHPFVHFFFYFVAFGMTIVQMNLFIGILSANYDKYSKQASALAARERAQLIRFVRGSVWSSLWSRCFGNRKRVNPFGEKDEEWLFAVFHDRPADEDE